MDWVLWRRWTITVGAGELAGFTAPAFAGAVLADASAGPGVTYVALLAAGAVEGWCLGYAQAWAVRDHIRALPRRAFAAATAAAAVLAYAVGMLPSSLGDRLDSAPVAVLVAGAVVGGGLLLFSIGGAQWLVLRRIGLARWWWVAVTAAAWLAGLAVFMLVATPLWREGQPLAVTVLVGVFAGALMAAAVAGLTGLAAVRLAGIAAKERDAARRTRPSPRAGSA
jgi:uncharacterized integral membrane protein